MCKLPRSAPLAGVVMGDSVEKTKGAPNAPIEDENLRGRLTREYQTLKPFVVISSSYLLFTITDGGVRTIVLFNAFERDFTAFQVSLMFVLYELAGVVTNFLAGIAGARWGLRSTLLAGLCLQVVGIGMLFGWQKSFTKTEAIIFVTVAQMLSGIAKDLVKLGGKAVTKLVTPEGKEGRLFKMVSMITGLKNSLKGVGMFIGAALVQVTYFGALGTMLGIVLLAVPWAVLSLESDLGRMRRENITLSSIFKKNHNVNFLSAARFFLFASRDAWFEVPLPFYLRSPEGFGWERAAAGAFLGGWVIMYGQVQSWTPQLFSKPLRQFPANKYHATLWVAILLVIPALLGSVMQFSDVFQSGTSQAAKIAIVVVALVAFAVVFAVNSSIHSYLVVKYSEGDKVAMNVGFYYMSNAAGRLIGTLVGGALFQWVGDDFNDGLAACFWFSVALTAATIVITPFLDDSDGGLQCGPCLTCIGSGSATGDKEKTPDENTGPGVAEVQEPGSGPAVLA